MKKLAFATLWFLLTFPLSLAQAHFIWIETDPKGEPGKNQKVEIYFGEPHEFLREEAGGRLDQHDRIEAWAAAAKGEKTKVGLKKGVNLFSGVITPQKVGRYNLTAKSLGHEVQDLTGFGQGISRPLFFARGQFLSFERGRVSEREEEIKEYLDLDIIPVTKSLDPLIGTIVPKVGNELVVRVVFKGKPLARQRVNAFGPNGWIKELPSTDSWGVTSFVPLWPGRYVLQISQDEKAPGEFKGKSYETLNYRATLSLLVDKRD